MKSPLALILAAGKLKAAPAAEESSDKVDLAQELIDALASKKAAKVADALEAFVSCCGMGEDEDD